MNLKLLAAIYLLVILIVGQRVRDWIFWNFRPDVEPCTGPVEMVKSLFILLISLSISASLEDDKQTIRNLIMGTQKGLLPHEMRVFLASLRSTGCDARVLIFNAEEDRVDLNDITDTFGAEIVRYNETVFSEHGPMNLHRFHLFRLELERTVQNPYDQVQAERRSHAI